MFSPVYMSLGIPVGQRVNLTNEGLIVLVLGEEKISLQRKYNNIGEGSTQLEKLKG